ncbi:MAG: 50S ribosomal protein L23 [Deferribacteraceae bacterium]|jgi:large subunit ribosomal protein L23|nr:50S ribosomal protein L23 [Deferribacteraceae bacterium]
MITIYDVLQRPMMTEKSMMLKEADNTIVFKVHPEANKRQIKEAVEQFFNVKVKEVRSMNYNGKEKRFGRTMGRRNDWKKALVVLKEGETLEFV